MSRWCGIVCLLLIPLIAVACGGGDTTSTASDAEPTLDSLVARYVEARGGAERLASIETLRMTGRATAGPGREAEVSREVRPPGRIRTEFAFQGVTSVYACDGSECWYVDPMQNVFEAELMSADETAVAMEEADVLAAVDWKEKGHQVELLGLEEIDGRGAYKFNVVLSNGPSRTVWLDAETALVVRREMYRARGGRTVEVRTDYGDFREVEGLVFPHSIRTGAVDSEDVLEVTVERIEINAPLDDSRFAMPRN